MRPTIPSPEPPQPIPLIPANKHLLHLLIREPLRPREIVEHARLVDEREDGCDGRRLAGHEGATAADEDQDCGEYHEGYDGGREDGGGVVAVWRFGAE